MFECLLRICVDTLGHIFLLWMHQLVFYLSQALSFGVQGSIHLSFYILHFTAVLLCCTRQTHFGWIVADEFRSLSGVWWCGSGYFCIFWSDRTEFTLGFLLDANSNPHINKWTETHLQSVSRMCSIVTMSFKKYAFMLLLIIAKNKLCSFS